MPLQNCLFQAEFGTLAAVSIRKEEKDSSNQRKFASEGWITRAAVCKAALYTFSVNV